MATGEVAGKAAGEVAGEAAWVVAKASMADRQVAAGAPLA